ncbi:Tryptophan--tRNA ligase, mitochondrial [Halotydeus destructor]|nr:Tryptophan--tRNA ligase, mitochondrial [Halotydeus destructor]
MFSAIRKCSLLFPLIYRRGLTTQAKSRVVYSGIQPTGCIHLGNYFGAISNWLRLQDDVDADCIFGIVDLHSITSKHEPVQLAKNTHLMVACLLACGIDPNKCILYKQSDIPQHSELAWIFICMSTIAQLQRFPQFKEKCEGLKEEPLGLLAYPVLQCADILLFKANEVPVGEDQLAHIHMCQSMSNRFNGRYGKVFPFPQPKLSHEQLATRIRSLRIPDKKMGKSESDPRGRIEILDSPEMIIEKLKKAVTDSISDVTFDPVNRPGVSNLVLLHSLLAQKTTEAVVANCSGLTTGQYKLQLADLIIEKISPLRNEAMRLLEDQQYLESVLELGRSKAYERAEETMNQVKQSVGLTSSSKNSLLKKQDSKL